MKRLLLAICSAAFLLTGCTGNTPQPATQPRPSETVELPALGAPGETVAAVVLDDIWSQYEPQERFAVYGGIPERPVAEAVGDLDLQLPEKWALRCRFPITCVEKVDQGASLTHLLNETLFHSAVFRLKQSEDAASVLQQWRREMQTSQWPTISPERLLLARVGDRYLVMAMGSKDNISMFRQKLTDAYPAARIFYEEPITC